MNDDSPTIGQLSAVEMTERATPPTHSDRSERVRDLPGVPFPKQFASFDRGFSADEWLAKKVTAEEKRMVDYRCCRLIDA